MLQSELPVSHQAAGKAEKTEYEFKLLLQHTSFFKADSGSTTGLPLLRFYPRDTKEKILVVHIVNTLSCVWKTAYNSRKEAISWLVGFFSLLFISSSGICKTFFSIANASQIPSHTSQIKQFKRFSSNSASFGKILLNKYKYFSLFFTLFYSIQQRFRHSQSQVLSPSLKNHILPFIRWRYWTVKLDRIVHFSTCKIWQWLYPLCRFTICDYLTCALK